MSKRIVLVTVGFGGSTCYVDEPEASYTTKIESYDREEWRKYLDPDSEYDLTGTPVVDCTVESCNVSNWAIKGPMFDQRLGANEFSEFLRKPAAWHGERLSGMANAGRDVYLVHAAAFGCQITDAVTGEPFPVPDVELTGTADARSNLIALGTAVDPVSTIKAVMLADLTAFEKD